MTHAIPQRQPAGAGRLLYVALASALRAWRARQQARKTMKLLSEMPDHLLKDIGLMQDRSGLLRDPVQLLPGPAFIPR